jgi:hypothetical protein
MFFKSKTPFEVARITEAALAFNTSHDALRDQLRAALRKEHGLTEDSWSSSGPWVTSVFPSQVVYQFEGKTYRRSYTVTAGEAGQEPTITLGGAAKPVHVAFVDSKSTESFGYLSTAPADWEFVDLPAVVAEANVTVTPNGVTAVRESVTMDLLEDVKESARLPKVRVKLIQSGWGSKAYYPKEILKRDGPTAFPKELHMYWNHQTDSEESERPENDVNNLAAVLTENAAWDDNGPKGPGLYSYAKVFSDYASQVAEKGPHIGVSINAGIRGHVGEAEGRQGLIADEFVVGYSTDFVTKAGAGGAVITPVIESAGGTPANERKGMTAEEIKAQETLTAENTSLKQRVLVMEAAHNRRLAIATVSAVLQEAGITFNEKLVERACVAPTMKDGVPCPEWIKGVVADFSAGETGKVKDLGESKAPVVDKEANKRLRESMMRMGMSQAEAESVLGKEV